MRQAPICASKLLCVLGSRFLKVIFVLVLLFICSLFNVLVVGNLGSAVGVLLGFQHCFLELLQTKSSCVFKT